MPEVLREHIQELEFLLYKSHCEGVLCSIRVFLMVRLREQKVPMRSE
jgi:hypothetical protein